MGPTLLISLLWVGFALSHMLLASRGLRPRLVRALGEPAFLGLYSAVAFAFFVPLCWIYFTNRHSGPVLWAIPLGTLGLWTLYVLQGVAWIFVVAGLLRPSPATVRAPSTAGVRGVHRLARHPLFVGLGLFGALHLVSNGTASDVAFFAGFPIFGTLGAWHQDRRKLATGGPRFQKFVESAPFVPFTGRETQRGLRELSRPAIVIGVLLTAVLRWLHGPLFGP